MLRWEGALLITSDVRTQWLAEFRAWHNLEHLPERMAIPGFVAARRFVSTEREDRFLTLYALASIEVLHGAPYRALLDDPDVATMRILKGAVTNTVRLLCRRAGGFARGEGGLVTLQADPLHATLAQIAALEGNAEVAAAHLLVPDALMTAAPSTAVPNLMLPPSPAAMMIVESWSSHVVGSKQLAGVGFGAPDVYRLEAAVTSTA